MAKHANIQSATLTRPATTTQYTANDAMSDSASAPTALQWNSVNNTGHITGLTVTDGANQATLPQLEVYVFTASPTATNDNTEFGATDAEALTLVAAFSVATFYDLDPTAGTNGNAFACVTPIGDGPRSYACSTDNTLYGLVKVLNTYTPLSGEIFTFVLHTEED